MIRVLGLGNSLRGDDGVGPEVVRLLQRDHAAEFSEITDVGSDALTILEKLLEKSPVLVVDCARMGLTPGSIRRWSADDEGFIPSVHGFSLHGFNLADIWRMAKTMDIDIDLIIIGVEPEHLEFNRGLSKPVRKSLPSIIKLVREEAKKHAS